MPATAGYLAIHELPYSTVMGRTHGVLLQELVGL